MTTLSIQPPYPIITDIDGQPLEDGYIWIGVAGLNPIGNPIAVYWDAALTQPAGLPIRTQGGYPMNAGTPARLYVGSDYSILVLDKNGSVVYSAPQATERYSDPVITGIDSSEVTFLQAGTGAVVRSAQSKMRDVVSALDFGASHSNSAAANRAAFQAAVDYLEGRGGGTLYIPTGTYETTEIALGWNLEIVGEAGAVIKRPNSATDPNVRLFSTEDKPWQSASDSPPLTIRNLTFDGNRAGNTPWSGYEREQWASVFIMGDPAYAGRRNVVVDNCRFINSPGDGLSVYVNSRVKATNITGTTNFRGLITIHGGYSETFITNMSDELGTLCSGLHIESDGSGYGGSNRCDVTVDGARIINGCSFGAPDSSRVEVTNLHMLGPGVSWSADAAFHKYTNCHFKLGNLNNNRIVYPGHMQFTNCIFELEYDGSASGAEYGLGFRTHDDINVPAQRKSNQRVQFSNCQFFADSSVASNSGVAYGIKFDIDATTYNNVFVVQNCNFDSSLNYGVQTFGGIRILKDLYNNADLPVRCLQPNGAIGSDITIDGMSLGANPTSWAFINVAAANDIFRINNCAVDVAQQAVGTSSGYTSGTFYGNRIVNTNVAPTLDMPSGGLNGDIFQIDTVTLGNDYRWIKKLVPNTGTVYKVILTIPA